MRAERGNISKFIMIFSDTPHTRRSALKKQGGW